MLKKYTNKRFYNKWIYKVTLTVKGGYIFRNHSFDDIRLYLLGTPPANFHFYDHKKLALANQDTILEIISFLENNKGKEYGKRIEGNFLDFYTNDVIFYQDMIKVFEPIVRHGFEPFPGMEDDVLNSTMIFAKKLPHNKYRFKVYLLPHKLKHDIDLKRSFLTWIDSQSPRVLISDAVKKWFIDTDWNWDRRYVLVEDDKTLFMMQLRNSEVMGKVHEYRLVDK